MRCMVRNERTFYYAQYIGKTDILDEYGNLTGESEIKYSNPVKVHGNISSAKGVMESRQFGETESYDRVIVMGDENTPINEYSVLWVDTLPHLEEDGSTLTPYDYVVKEVARGLTSVSIAIGKVKVNG